MSEIRVKRAYNKRIVESEIVQPSNYNINERFQFVDQMVMMLAEGDQASVVLTGPGGLGKSHTVIHSLISAGYEDISNAEGIDMSDYPEVKAFKKVSGYMTPKGLYRELYENRTSVLVFDDIDSILQNEISINILKAALDSYSTRIISYKADIKDLDLPKSFEFTGRVVFISNLSSTKIDQAIISRSLSVDLSMTNSEKIDRMKFLLTQGNFMPQYDPEYKNDALSLIESVKDRVKELSLRTLIQVTKIRASNPDGNWENLSRYVMCG